MADSYAEHQRGIQATSEHIDEVQSAKGKPSASKGSSGGVLDWLMSKAASPRDTEGKAEPGVIGRLREQVLQQVDVGARLKSLALAGEKLTERVVRLMVVFLLQTLVIPLVFGVGLGSNGWGPASGWPVVCPLGQSGALSSLRQQEGK